VSAWLDFQRNFWNGSLDRLEAKLKQSKGGKTT
jgi:hypothetical protein